MNRFQRDTELMCFAQMIITRRKIGFTRKTYTTTAPHTRSQNMKIEYATYCVRNFDVDWTKWRVSKQHWRVHLACARHRRSRHWTLLLALCLLVLPLSLLLRVIFNYSVRLSVSVCTGRLITQFAVSLCYNSQRRTHTQLSCVIVWPFSVKLYYYFLPSQFSNAAFLTYSLLIDQTSFTVSDSSDEEPSQS